MAQFQDGKKPQAPADLPQIGADDEMDDQSVKRLLKDLIPMPADPLTVGLEKGRDYRQVKLIFRAEEDERMVTAYQALETAAKRQFMMQFFVEIEVMAKTGQYQRFFVSEYDAKEAERFGAKRLT